LLLLLLLLLWAPLACGDGVRGLLNTDQAGTLEKGVCDCHWTVILNRGSGGRGQSGFGFV